MLALVQLDYLELIGGSNLFERADHSASTRAHRVSVDDVGHGVLLSLCLPNHNRNVRFKVSVEV